MVRQDATPVWFGLDLDARPASSFLPLLLAGVGVEVEAALTVGGLLGRLTDLRDGEAAALAATVLLDGHPVDDLEASTVGDGSRVALSGPLPGLAGASLRRDGVLAPLRRSLGPPPAGSRPAGVATVSLFNLLIHSLGPPLLAKGVLVDGNALAAFLESRTATFWTGVRAVTVSDRPLTADVPSAVCREIPAGRVRLTVVRAQAPPGRSAEA